MSNPADITGGLVSVTFRQLSTREIVSLVRKSGLECIEWGGDIHVPHGDTKAAYETGRMTRDAGIETVSYGSYYRAFESENDSLPFSKVLDTAIALGSPMIRIWAGARSPDKADEDYRELVIEDTLRVAELAAAENIGIVFEYHSGTLTETPASTIDLLEKIDHPNVRTCWQTCKQADPDARLHSLKTVLPHLANVHVFNWKVEDGKTLRLPLAEGKDEWKRYIEIMSGSSGRRYALLEFVRDDDPEVFLEDSRTLSRIIEETTGRRI